MSCEGFREGLKANPSFHRQDGPGGCKGRWPCSRQTREWPSPTHLLAQVSGSWAFPLESQGWDRSRIWLIALPERHWKTRREVGGGSGKEAGYQQGGAASQVPQARAFLPPGSDVTNLEVRNVPRVGAEGHLLAEQGLQVTSLTHRKGREGFRPNTQAKRGREINNGL